MTNSLVGKKMAVSNSGWPSLEYLGQIFSPLAPSYGQWINVRSGGWWFYPRTVHYLQVASHLCVLLFLCSVPVTLATELDRTAFVHIRLTEPPPPEGGSSPPGGSSSNNTSGESPTTTTSSSSSSTSQNNTSNNNNNNNNNNRRDRTTQGRHRGGNWPSGHSADPRVATPEAHREVHMKGWFAKAGNVKFAEGPLHLVRHFNVFISV